MKKEYRVYLVNRLFGFPMFQGAFASKAEAQTFIANQGGNTKERWFKIEAMSCSR